MGSSSESVIVQDPEIHSGEPVFRGTRVPSLWSRFAASEFCNESQKKMLDGGMFRNIERLGNTGFALLTPKSKKSRRQIEMGPALTSLLERMKHHGNSCQFVFQDEFGKAIDPDRVNKILRAAPQQRVFISASTVLDTCIRVCWSRQERISSRLRSASVTRATTADIYTHVVSDEGRKLSEKVPRFLSLAKF